MFGIIQNRKLWYLCSGLLLLASVGVVAIMGIRPGIDFTGGSLLEVSYSQQRPAAEEVTSLLSEVGIDSPQIQEVGGDGYLIRMPDISDEKRRSILEGLREMIGDTGQGQESVIQTEQSGGQEAGGIELQVEPQEEGEDESRNQLTEERFEAIGPVIGSELQSRSIQAVIGILIMILIYIAFAFRKVSWPVQSWKYGIVALLTLFHDVIIMFGVYTFLTHAFGWELNTAFVAAILTVVGYSVNDTIVVFDRVRENLLKQSEGFEDTVNASVNQTISRSLITSLTTLIVLISVIAVGGTTIQGFVAALAVGVLIGTYSSIFVASPLLVTLHKRSKRAA